jgi:aryl-phospho-beta-D-glucosidase BglC (GH1 family)
MRKLNIHFLLFILTVVLNLNASAQGLKASGKKIVDSNGNEVILRGMGLGGWMLQEPYMMEMSGFAAAQWDMKAKIKALIGDANTESFYNAWHAMHCTKTDIDSMAAWGFNSIRLPMHYNLYTLPVEEEPVAGQNTWLEKGFVMTDSLISWCKANQMYVILDLHAAPGGQGKTRLSVITILQNLRCGKAMPISRKPLPYGENWPNAMPMSPG